MTTNLQREAVKQNLVMTFYRAILPEDLSSQVTFICRGLGTAVVSVDTHYDGKCYVAFITYWEDSL